MAKTLRHVSALVFLVAALVSLDSTRVAADDCAIVNYACSWTQMGTLYSLECNPYLVSCGDIQACADQMQCIYLGCGDDGSSVFGGLSC